MRPYQQASEALRFELAIIPVHPNGSSLCADLSHSSNKKIVHRKIILVCNLIVNLLAGFIRIYQISEAGKNCMPTKQCVQEYYASLKGLDDRWMDLYADEPVFADASHTFELAGILENRLPDRAKFIESAVRFGRIDVG